MTPPFDNAFPHQRLRAYRLALEVYAGAWALSENFPRGQAVLEDQLRRASLSAVLQLAEGANRWSAKDKLSRFACVRGELGEVAAACEAAAVVGLADVEQAATIADRAGKAAAMVTNLMKRLQ